MDQDSESTPVMPGSVPAPDSFASLEAEAEAATPEQPSIFTPMLPTNHFQDIKVQANGIQIIATTQAHLLNVKTAWAGDHSAQFVGTTHDATLEEIARTFIQHQIGIPDPSPSVKPDTARPGDTLGPGRPLGTTRSFSAGDKKL